MLTAAVALLFMYDEPVVDAMLGFHQALNKFWPNASGLWLGGTMFLLACGFIGSSVIASVSELQQERFCRWWSQWGGLFVIIAALLAFWVAFFGLWGGFIMVTILTSVGLSVHKKHATRGRTWESLPASLLLYPCADARPRCTSPSMAVSTRSTISSF